MPGWRVTDVVLIGDGVGVGRILSSPKNFMRYQQEELSNSTAYNFPRVKSLTSTNK